MADDTYISGLISGADPGETIILPWRSTPYLLDGQVNITKGLTFDFNGNTIQFEYHSGTDPAVGANKGFVVKAGTTAERVIFRNGVLEGTGIDQWRNAKGPVITSESGVQLGLYHIDSCVFQNLSFGCDFNCASSGYIRNAILTNCLFDNMLQDPNAPQGNDTDRGKGAVFALRQAVDTNDPSIKILHFLENT